MSDPTPRAAPSLNLPKGESVCTTAIIDTTCTITVPTLALVEPKIPGHDYLNLPDYTFHIKHEASGAELLFDAGTRVDWDKAVPAIVDLVGNHVAGLKVDKDIVDVLREGGVNPDNLKAFILSHW